MSEKISGYIYAIGQAGTQFIKIGCTTGAIEERLRSLQIGSPVPLVLIQAVGVYGSLFDIEKSLHNILNSRLCSGEWFRDPFEHYSLIELIQQVSKQQTLIMQKISIAKKPGRKPKYTKEEERPLTVSLRIPRHLWDQLCLYSTKHHQTVTHILLEGLQWRLHNEKEKQPHTWNEPL
jgi:hypothetical protein